MIEMVKNDHGIACCECQKMEPQVLCHISAFLVGFTQIPCLFNQLQCATRKTPPSIAYTFENYACAVHYQLTQG